MVQAHSKLCVEDCKDLSQQAHPKDIVTIEAVGGLLHFQFALVLWQQIPFFFLMFLMGSYAGYAIRKWVH